jgi:hypothetical protein
MGLITGCRLIHGWTVVRAAVAGMVAAAAVPALLALVAGVPEAAWLMLPLMPVCFLAALPLGALAGRLAAVPYPARTAGYGWLLALVAGEALAWLPTGYDVGGRVIIVGPFLALLALPVTFAVTAGFTS